MDAILALCFEPLGRRTKDADWEVRADVAIEFVPVSNLDESHRPLIAEKLQFNNLINFLYADF